MISSRIAWVAGRGCRHHNVGLCLGDSLYHNASAFSIAGVPIIIDPKIAFRCPAKLAQAEFKCRDAGQRFPGRLPQ